MLRRWWLRLHPQWAALTIVGVMFLVRAQALYSVTPGSTISRIVWVDAWPWLFGTAGVACLTVAGLGWRWPRGHLLAWMLVGGVLIARVAAIGRLVGFEQMLEVSSPDITTVGLVALLGASTLPHEIRRRSDRSAGHRRGV